MNASKWHANMNGEFIILGILLKRCLLIAVTALMLLFLSCSLREGKKPVNVILVLIDDMGYGDIAAHGNPLLKTPNFDQFYFESARFSDFSVSPTCAPTRAALLTGTHEFLVGVTHTRSPMNYLEEGAVTIAELFQVNGYKTGIFGKWHLGQVGQYGPWYRGFEETLTVPNDDQRSHFDPVLLHNREERRFHGYREDILFREAMKFIATNKEEGFFCYLSTYSPHSPNKVPEEYSRPYEGYVTPERPEGEYRSDFFGQVANIDENIGRLSRFLDSIGSSENTLMILMNDNGGTFGVDTYNSGMRGVKTTPWRGGTRAFSFWKWGKHFAPGERKVMCSHQDVFPTLAELFKLELTPRLDEQLRGSSLVSILKDPVAERHNNRMIITHIGRWSFPEKWEEHKYAGCAVRWGNYSLVRHEPCNDLKCGTCLTAWKRGMDKTRPLYTNNTDHYILPPKGKWELYDIGIDPHQDQDIAYANPEMVSKMSEYYETWWDEVVRSMASTREKSN